MADSAALLVDEILPYQPMRQLTPGMACSRAMQEKLPRVLSVPFSLRFLFASNPTAMTAALGIVYRTIATHLVHKAGFTKTMAHTGAVTLIQRFGGAVNLNIHFHMLFPDGVYIQGAWESAMRSVWVKAPTSDELTQLTHTIAQRVALYLERQGLLVRDAENGYLTVGAADEENENAMNPLRGSSITYRIAIGPQQGRKVFTLQTLPDCGNDPLAKSPFNTLGLLAI